MNRTSADRRIHPNPGKVMRIKERDPSGARTVYVLFNNSQVSGAGLPYKYRASADTMTSARATVRRVRYASGTRQFHNVFARLRMGSVFFAAKQSETGCRYSVVLFMSLSA